ncbi:MAG: phage holin family protein [bacterium]|nr:phage holin family protein [bacterium]
MIRPFITTTITLWILATFTPVVDFTTWLTLLLAGIILTLVQIFVKPVLSILFLPMTVVTFGFFSVVIQVALLWLVVFLVPGFHINPLIIVGVQLGYFFTLALVASIISLINGLVRATVGRFF